MRGFVLVPFSCFARVALVEFLFCRGCAWGVLRFFFRVLFSKKRVCVLQGCRLAACTRIRYLVPVCPCWSVLLVVFVYHDARTLACARARVALWLGRFWLFILLYL